MRLYPHVEWLDTERDGGYGYRLRKIAAVFIIYTVQKCINKGRESVCHCRSSEKRENYRPIMHKRVSDIINLSRILKGGRTSWASSSEVTLQVSLPPEAPAAFGAGERCGGQNAFHRRDELGPGAASREHLKLMARRERRLANIARTVVVNSKYEVCFRVE